MLSIPDSFMAGQFENLANPEFHYETTAQEIFDQMEGKIDAIVIGVGTGGTFSGVARYMKEKLPNVLLRCGRDAGLDPAGRRAR